MKEMLDFSFENYSEMLRKHHEQAASMSDHLRLLPMFRARADRMAKCGIYTKGIYCPKCHSFHTVRSSLCRDRLCPNCGWALAHKRARAVLYAIEELSEEMPIEVIHIVLTLKHDEDTRLCDQIKNLLTGFRNLMRRTVVRKHLIGYVRSVEIKCGNNGFHPHIHVMWIVDKDYSKDFIPQNELCELWATCCNVDYKPIVWIEKAYSMNEEGSGIHQAIYECVKYTIKTNEWLNMSVEQLKEAAEAIHGKQLFHICGDRLIPAYMAKMKEPVTIDERPTPCKKCGNERFIATINI